MVMDCTACARGGFLRLPVFPRLIRIFILAAPVCVLAQTPDSTPQPEPSDLPEEIIVTNPVSLIRLRAEVKEAEENMYDVFNDLNDNDRLDIHCRMEAPLGTKIKQHVCTPNYYLEAMDGEAHQFLKDAGVMGNVAPGPGAGIIEYYNNLLEDKMKEVASQSPEFREAVNNFKELSEHYEEQRKARFDLE